MITRTAVFEGRIKPGCEERFLKAFREELMPMWQEFPHASNIRLLPVVAADPGSPPIALIQQIDYPSVAHLEEALASPARARARALTLELMQMFEGRLYHLVSDRLVVESSAT
ncbi:MAG: hypothetical protein RLZZ200_2073 [Pseudomonadota bacterium]|jgi:hypothetical protein